MNDIVTLSQLLLNADSILQVTERQLRYRSWIVDLEGCADLERRYTQWGSGRLSNGVVYCLPDG
jgi:hypothetical protein